MTRTGIVITGRRNTLVAQLPRLLPRGLVARVTERVTRTPAAAPERARVGAAAVTVWTRTPAGRALRSTPGGPGRPRCWWGTCVVVQDRAAIEMGRADEVLSR